MTKEAMAAYNQAVRLDPKSPRAYNLRADAYRRYGRYHLAIKDYNEAVRISPEGAESYAGRAFAYTLLHKDEKARLDVVSAVKLGFDSTLIEREIEELTKRR
ncbi:MAG: tetratricopeptide repeat protein [Chloroflexi bacterium]|nr:tetratricopeptide repeat protein [Chloroflexota bacterium]MDA1271978.1 tetratricopeptide repeat protein [Chloroflexota bacterium]PKB58134.1 MAG: hypothetical protein BZY83_08760 [SAR202 cluster bacterium Casp-Chloro-G2]